MHVRKIKFLMGFLLACLLGACAHTPGPDSIPPNTEFTTRILADNTKLFVLQTKVSRRDGGEANSDDPDNSSAPDRSDTNGDHQRRGNGGGRGASSRGDNVGNREKTKAQDLKVIATAVISANHYCREGFVVLEQYSQNHGRVLRGECRDAANDIEHERFVH